MFFISGCFLSAGFFISGYFLLGSGGKIIHILSYKNLNLENCFYMGQRFCYVGMFLGERFFYLGVLFGVGRWWQNKSSRFYQTD